MSKACIDITRHLETNRTHMEYGSLLPPFGDEYNIVKSGPSSVFLNVGLKL